MVVTTVLCHVYVLVGNSMLRVETWSAKDTGSVLTEFTILALRVVNNQIKSNQVSRAVLQLGRAYGHEPDTALFGAEHVC